MIKSLITLLIFILCGCSVLNSSEEYTPNVYNFPPSSFFETPDDYDLSKSYYLDAVNGSDTLNDGSSERPWKTLGKAQSMVTSGSVVFLRSGQYGIYSENFSDRSSFVLYRAETNAEPLLKGISLIYSSSKPSGWLIFEGIKIQPDDVMQTIDPQDPESTQSTYNKTENPVSLYYAKNVWIRNCIIKGRSKYLTEKGVGIQYGSDIRIEGNEISMVHRGVSYAGASRVECLNNYVHEISGSAFQGGQASPSYRDILIKGNHATDSNYDFSDDYCPRAEDANYHGSAVSIRSSYVEVRDNIFHNGFNSSGLMLYDDDVAYTNITIENNELYDLRNSFVLRIFHLGRDVTVRNNLFVGHSRSSGAYYYDTGVVLHSVSDLASGLAFYNNIVVGLTDFGSWWDEIRQGNNIYYSCKTGAMGKFLVSAEVGGESYVASSGETAAIFEDGFFTGPVRFDWDDSDPLNAVGHGTVIDWNIASGSLATNFGNPTNQPVDAIEGLDGEGKFVIVVDRVTSQHSAGPRL